MAEATPRDYYETFYRAGAGARVLEDLLERFYNKSIYEPGITAMHMAWFEGQRAAVAFMLSMCEEGRDGDPEWQQVETDTNFDPYGPEPETRGELAY